MCTAMEIFKKKTEGIGFEKGKNAGIEKGQNEREIELVMNMYNHGMNVGDIAKYTNISQNEIIEYMKS